MDSLVESDLKKICAVALLNGRVFQAWMSVWSCANFDAAREFCTIAIIQF